MNNIFLTFNSPSGAADGLVALWRQLSLWWQRLPAGVRSPVWPATLATLVIVGMLLAFHQVVSGAVQQGEMRRKTTAMHVEANWRCGAARGLRASDDCLQRLHEASYSDTVLQARNSTTDGPIE